MVCAMAVSVEASLSAPLAAPAARRAYVRNAGFDATLLMAPALAGVAASGVVLAAPWLYAFVLLADLWLLGYHHVVATYTRLAFDGASLRTNRFLAIDLLVLVIAATLVLAMTAGAWVVVSAFLYLQWFHYTRQGYGIARMYFRATPQGQRADARDLAADLVIYLVPVYCIAARSATMGQEFLALPVRTLVLPEPVIAMLGVAAAAAVAAWLMRSARAAMCGSLDVTYTAFIASHVGIFVLGYVLIDDVNVGWLGVNVWHNFQYVLVVWMTNAKRYAGGVDPAAKLLSTISQPGRVVAYFATCLAITTVVYLLLDRITTLMLGGGLAVTLGLYMGINFHHYVVDALIWKRRRPAARAAA